MTELATYCDKLIEAIQDKNPLLLLRRITINASTAVALAEAHSISKDIAVLQKNIDVNHPCITSATESQLMERVLSYLCLQKFAKLYENTYAYKNAMLTEHCTKTDKFDKIAAHRLLNLSNYLKKFALPLLQTFQLSEGINSQYILRKLITVLDQVR